MDKKVKLLVTIFQGDKKELERPLCRCKVFNYSFCEEKVSQGYTVCTITANPLEIFRIGGYFRENQLNSVLLENHDLRD